jgi:DNA-binding MurR/RpiR family transcriptional regulator
MVPALKRLARIAKDNKERPALIAEARLAGATWEQIAEAADMSRAGVIKLAHKKTAQRPAPPPDPNS